jgi:hypothetical protein
MLLEGKKQILPCPASSQLVRAIFSADSSSFALPSL